MDMVLEQPPRSASGGTAGDVDTTAAPDGEAAQPRRDRNKPADMPVYRSSSLSNGL